MRGKLIIFSKKAINPRNIPAYAGKTDMSFSHDGLLSEHPRVCGENRESVHLVGDLFGTSPRMRGKQKSGRATRRRQRNIPAYAGKTDQSSWLSRRSGEHPRVCGENGKLVPVTDQTRGTSPRMRGKPSQFSRAISAHSEHPRVCGENVRDGYHPAQHLGTSPRMRGKPYSPQSHP